MENMVDNLDDKKIPNEHYHKTLELWRIRAHRGARAHYLASEHSIKWGKRITLLNAFFSILVLFFANASWIEKVIFDGEGTVYIISVSISSLLLVLFTIAQYLYRFDEQGQKHKEAGVQFANLMRKIERYLCSDQCTMGLLHNVNRIYNQITSSYPLVSTEIWNSKELSQLATEILDKEKEVDEYCS